MKVKTKLAESLTEAPANSGLPPWEGSAYKGLKPGDKVTYKKYAGMGLKGPEYKTATGKVLPMLVFKDHVVVSGGQFGNVVNDENFVKKG